jgi:hypothetical protein
MKALVFFISILSASERPVCPVPQRGHEAGIDANRGRFGTVSYTDNDSARPSAVKLQNAGSVACCDADWDLSLNTRKKCDKQAFIQNILDNNNKEMVNEVYVNLLLIGAKHAANL